MNINNSLWIMMLDISSSMETGYLSQDGRGNSKFETAKEVLVNSVSDLLPTELVIIVFNEEANVIYKGSSIDKMQILKALNGVTANGGTSIAKALSVVLEGRYQHKYAPINIVLITDGEDREERVLPIIDQLRSPNISLNPILIDPTSRAAALAEMIVLNGTIRTVTSKQDLKEAVKHHVKRHIPANSHQNVSVSNSTVKNIVQFAFSAEIPRVTGTYTRDYLSNFIHIASNPSKLFFTNDGDGKSILYACTSLLLGTGLYSIKRNVSLAHFMSILMIVLTSWAIYIGTIHILCKALRGKGNIAETTNPVLVFLPVVYAIANGIVLLWRLTISSGDGIIFFVVHTVLMFMYLRRHLPSAHQISTSMVTFAIIFHISFFYSISLFIPTDSLQQYPAILIPSNQSVTDLTVTPAPILTNLNINMPIFEIFVFATIALTIGLSVFFGNSIRVSVTNRKKDKISILMNEINQIERQIQITGLNISKDIITANEKDIETHNETLKLLQQKDEDLKKCVQKLEERAVWIQYSGVNIKEYGNELIQVREKIQNSQQEINEIQQKVHKLDKYINDFKSWKKVEPRFQELIKQLENTKKYLEQIESIKIRQVWKIFNLLYNDKNKTF